MLSQFLLYSKVAQSSTYMHSFSPMRELFSCDCHLVKPDIEIYQMLLDKYSLCASECVFLDDKQENVDGAEACGILGIVFTNLKEAIYKLNCMGIEFDYEVE